MNDLLLIPVTESTLEQALRVPATVTHEPQQTAALANLILFHVEQSSQ
jgi:hypothetical protein